MRIKTPKFSATGRMDCAGVVFVTVAICLGIRHVSVASASTETTHTLVDDVTHIPSIDAGKFGRENITVGIFVERSATLDFPFNVNRTYGLIHIAINKTREILQHTANLVCFMACNYTFY